MWKKGIFLTGESLGIERHVAGIDGTAEKGLVVAAANLVLKLFRLGGIAGRVKTADGIAVQKIGGRVRLHGTADSFHRKKHRMDAFRYEGFKVFVGNLGNDFWYGHSWLKG